jgi:hypothetical protein
LSQKIPSKAENEALRRALDGDFSPISSPDSPLIDRQSIGRSVEAELKAACRVLVEKTGNAHHNSQEDAIVNFSSLQRAAQHKNGSSKKVARAEREKSDKSGKGELSVKSDANKLPKRSSSMPPPTTELSTAQASEAPVTSEAPKQEVEKPTPEPQEPVKEEKLPQFPVRRDSLSSKKHALLAKQTKVITSEPEVPHLVEHTHRSQESESSSSDVSVGDSPMSASAEHQPQLMSTAPTTVSVTPATRPVRKAPTSLSTEGRALQGAVVKSERKAAEFLREAESTPVITQEAPSNVTDPNAVEQQSEDKSFVGGLKEFVRSRSRSRSRSREPGTLRRKTSTTLQGLRTGFENIRRKPSMSDLFSTSSTAPSTRPATAPREDRSDPLLDRELPPLPSLDAFKEAQEKQAKLVAAEQAKVDASKPQEEIYELEANEPTTVLAEKSEPEPEKVEVEEVVPVQAEAVDERNIIEKKLDAEMKKIDEQKKTEDPTQNRPRRTTVHIVTAQRPKTSSSMAPSTLRNASTTDTLSKPSHRARSSSLKSVRKPSVSVCTATMVPVRPVRKYSVAESETKNSSKDSCFTADNESDCPKRSIDVMVKAATLAQKPSVESFRQINIKSRRNTAASALSQSHAPSQQSSRPQSRAAPSTTGARTPNARYTIIPHQRTPSQPIFLNRSAASSVVNLPARPATRDATSMPSRSRMPSVTSRSEHPPLPMNFSRKIAEGASRPTTSAGVKESRAPAAEITALPVFPSKKPSGLRRMLSSLSVRKMKSFDVRWASRDNSKMSGQIAVA